MNQSEVLESLVRIEAPEQLGDDELLEVIALLTDLSLDLSRTDGLERALELTSMLEHRRPKSEVLALLFYFRSNIVANQFSLETQNGQANLWSWENSFLELQIIDLRSARLEQHFRLLPNVRKLQILTNLGNLLSHVGRFVDAIRCWDEALKIDSSFGMALGNRGYGLIHYANSLYDPGHRCCFLLEARQNLMAALQQPLEPNTHDFFTSHLGRVETALDAAEADREWHFEEFSLGKSKHEIRYRRWALDHRLFLNPLNDLYAHSIAARDVLSNPPLTTALDEGPKLLGFFNQLKQEFVSARFMLFEGTEGDQPHFADRDVQLVNTLDYPNYSIYLEKTKVAFRSAYSILDKIAFFLNDYLSLGIPEKSVYFRTLWYEKQEPKKGLRSDFQHRQNWPLRGLFWLSKDLFEKSAEFAGVLEPEAQNLAEIRQYLEHKYLKVHDDFWIELKSSLSGVEASPAGLHDSLAYSVSRSEIELKALHILRLARAALIYLALAIHAEERTRAKNLDRNKIFPMPISLIEDEWKH